MPELPEVETIKNELTPFIIGRRVTDITILDAKIVRQPSVAEFRSRLVGQTITATGRKGKYLILSLSSGDFWIVHLKISGSLLLHRESAEAPKSTRAIIRLDDGSTIFFRDPRGFGVMWVVKDKGTVVGKLGPEPIKNNFKSEDLARLLAGRRSPIKAVLLDQTIMAGIGNMYADEALFAARIHPSKLAGKLTEQEVKRLYRAIRKVLNAGILNKGASVQNYYRPSGEKGAAHHEFQVAHGRNKLCPRCGTRIKRITVRNRGTYFCPRCQTE